MPYSIHIIIVIMLVLHHLIPTNVLQYIGLGAKEVMLCKYDALRGTEITPNRLKQ